ncbi:MAG: hypothetical protein JWM96_1113, partial [Alphaproteobacteria bacterium]|nr:hypothetical protein [Alphaproteobacteria bacterium]
SEKSIQGNMTLSGRNNLIKLVRQKKSFVILPEKKSGAAE